MNQPVRRRLPVLLALAGLVGILIWLFQPPAATQSRPIRLMHRSVRWPVHWVQGRLARPDQRLSLTLDSVAWETLTEARNVALRRGLLPNEAKTWVPAWIRADDELGQEGRVRLKGDYPDHWVGRKWSLRIQLPPEATPVWGMRTFSIQDPATREFLAEWLLHRLLRAEGLLAIRYEFGAVKINGEAKGIYAIEESFGPELLTANHRRGLLLKFDETALIDPEKRAAPDQDEFAIFRAAPIEPFDKARVLADPVLASQFQRARSLLAGVRAGSLPLDSAFDAAAAGKLYAVCDLMGAHHATRWKNSRFAYDPATDRLTLIAYDGNAGERIPRPYPTATADRPLYRHDDPPAWKARFFTSETFRAAYRAEAARLSAPSYWEDFVEQAEPALTSYRRLMYRDRPTYDFNWLRENVDANRDVLRTYLASVSH